MRIAEDELKLILQQPIPESFLDEAETVAEVLKLIKRREECGDVLWAMYLSFSYGVMVGKRLERRRQKESRS